MTLVILSGLPLIMHMVRAASLSAGSKDSVREEDRGREREREGERGREKERKEEDGGEEGGRERGERKRREKERGERGEREERGRGKKAGSESKHKLQGIPSGSILDHLVPSHAYLKVSPGTVTMVTQPLKCRAGNLNQYTNESNIYKLLAESFQQLIAPGHQRKIEKGI